MVNVLVVDDQPANLLAVEATLADLDLNVVRAGSGFEALRCLLDADFARRHDSDHHQGGCCAGGPGWRRAGSRH